MPPAVGEPDTDACALPSPTADETAAGPKATKLQAVLDSEPLAGSVALDCANEP